MTEQAQARPGHEHVAAVRARLQQQRWAGIEWWQATDTDDEGLHRRRGASNPGAVIADVLEAAAELGLLAGHAIPTVATATRIVLERITQAAEAYLTRSAEAVAGRGRAELRRHLADATTDAWMLLRPNSAGVGPDQDAPPARQDGPGAANTPESVAPSPPEPLRGAQAVPEDVLKAARAGAGNPGIEQMFTGPIALARGDQLRAQLDRSLALLHNVLDDHWLDLPGRPAGQPGAMRFLDGGQLAGWRQRMAAIEEAVDPNYEGPHRSRNFPVEYADDAYQADPATLQRSQEAISAVLDLCATADEHRSEAGPYAALYEWAPKVRAEIATHLGKTPAAMPLPAATRVALAQLVAAVEHHLTTDADDTLSAGYRRGARDGLDCRIREARQALGRGAH